MTEKKSLEGWYEGIGISNLEVDSILKRIMSLSIENIDKLWKEFGWVDSEAENDNRKALPNWRLDKIKNNPEFAEESFVFLINEEPYQELRSAARFLEILSKLEKKEKKK